MSAFHPKQTFGAALSIGREDLAELEATKCGGEMALEDAPPLLRVGDRSPHDDPVGAALLDVNDEDGAILPRALRARLNCRRPEMSILRTERATDLGGQFCRKQRSLEGAASSAGVANTISANRIFRFIAKA